MIFISHDLSVVRYLADRVVVMYLGLIMEQGTTDQVFSPPYHPYTEALLSAVPIADTSVKKKHIVLKGELPSPMNPPPGCPFQTRCHRKIGAICETEMPPVKDMGNGPQDPVPSAGRGAAGHGAGHRHGEGPVPSRQAGAQTRKTSAKAAARDRVIRPCNPSL